ncbi:MAG: GNAT family N-acetyltransferase, partial [Rubrivivax sp.]
MDDPMNDPTSEPVGGPIREPVSVPPANAPPVAADAATPALHLGTLEAPEDIEACVALMRGSDPWRRLGVSEEVCRRSIVHPERQAHAAWRGGMLVGFIVLAFQGPFSGYVQLLGVAESARGQGVGRALMELAERIAFARGPNLFLCVSDFNTPARRFYGRLGFVEIGRLADFIVAGEDEWLLRKTRGPLLGA